MVDMNPDLRGLAPYVAWRMKELYETAPQAFHEMRGRFVAEVGPCNSPKEALATTHEGVEWWLHNCAEFRLERMRYSQKRVSKSAKR